MKEAERKGKYELRLTLLVTYPKAPLPPASMLTALAPLWHWHWQCSESIAGRVGVWPSAGQQNMKEICWARPPILSSLVQHIKNPSPFLLLDTDTWGLCKGEGSHHDWTRMTEHSDNKGWSWGHHKPLMHPGRTYFQNFHGMRLTVEPLVLTGALLLRPKES